MPDGALTLYAPLVMMSIFGIPHGALDAALLNARFSSSKRIMLFSAYITLAIFCIALWSVAPTPSMLLFLLLSVVHFGRSDIADRNVNHLHIETLARGGLWALALPLYHWEVVEPIFAQLNTNTEIIDRVLTLSLPVWGMACAALCFFALKTRTYRSLAALAIGLTLIYSLPPLWSLGLYFCVWHARRHTQWALAKLSNPGRAQKLKQNTTALTLLIALGAFYVMPADISLTTAVIQLFFVGIFALTVPHMLLIDYYLPRHSALAFEHEQRDDQ